MSKVITEEKLIDEVLERSVEQVFPDKETLKRRLMSGERLRLYCGFDPSADSLHIGNAIIINKLAQFQSLGHEIIFLIGDFTGMIGDPTDKNATRAKLSRQEVLQNAKDYQKQASGYLKFDGENPARVEYNSRWNDKLTFREIIEISSNFTVQQMLHRDMFQKRIEEEKPIHLHEFLYPLIQGYDSVAMDVDLEIGGNDQMFNMLAGRTLQKAVNNKEKFVLTLKLLADDSGKKMGKSEGNAVFLNQTAQDMFGKIMSWPDEIIAIAFELCTKISMQEVKEMDSQLKKDLVNPRDLKIKLAFEIVKINHGQETAQEAQDYFERVFSKKELPSEISELVVFSGENILDVLVREKLAESKGEAKRKIEQGGVKIDDQLVENSTKEISPQDDNKIIRVGKRQFRRLIVK